MNPAFAGRAARLVAVSGFSLGFAVLSYYLTSLLYPFLIGFFLAFFINPVVDFIQYKGKMPRSFAVLLSLMLLLGSIAGLVTLLIVEIASGADYLARTVPLHLNTLISFIEERFAAQIIPIYNNFASIFQSLDSGQQETILMNIKTVGSRISLAAGDFIQTFFENIPKILSWFPNAASVLVFSLLGTFFISKDWYRLWALGGKFLPLKARKSGRTVFEDLRKALLGFLKAQTTLVSITTVIVLIGLLVLKVDYAITISLVTGIVDLIPYLGTGAVFLPWIGYELISGDHASALGLGILYTIVLVQRQIMEPRLLSSGLGLDPLATLIALFVGFKLLGFIGLIMGPVTLVIFNALHRGGVFRDLWGYIKG
ncbi:sporulation integral membrane protein YtvI [Bacillus massilinigeriensis]|uniref:sporulation integral membrane protein YtvI n=1 Tax=Bacillus mediterraneensis TaxID=1805474 RepID=UPI0008F84607|nr:sporulation integral membrane protein YtvI [Bacillus mediterraneensis]